MTTPPAPSVFDYLDYRAFLRDYYLDKKATRGLSYRSLARRMGLKSSNFLKLVIDGKRNLSEETALRLVEALALAGDSRDFFLELTRFAHASSTEGKNAAYERLTGFKRYRSARPLDAAHLSYYTTWYLPAIRELAIRTDFKEDPSWIARTLWPTITSSEAKRALETLLQLGLLTRDDGGRLSQGEPLLSTGPVTDRLHVVNYHRTMMGMAARALDDIPSDERDISSLTLCLNPDGIRRVRERIRRFRRELLDMSVTEQRAEQVVQVNFQLFPLSRRDR